MRGRGVLTAFAVLSLLALTGSARGGTAEVPAAPARWVTDSAGLLSPAARARLDARLEAVQRQTGHQVVVWIADTIAGAPLDDWAVRTFAAWKIGRAGLDDGVAMFILAHDRAIDIEVGYGLEAQLPDVVAKRIIEDVMAPRLRAGDADAAVTAGVDAILGAIEGHPVGDVAPPPGNARRPGPDLPELILIGIGVLAFVVLLIFKPRLALFLLARVVSGVRNGSRDHGGFRGGGGRSGGGGSRGRW